MKRLSFLSSRYPPAPPETACSDDEDSADQASAHLDAAGELAANRAREPRDRAGERFIADDRLAGRSEVCVQFAGAAGKGGGITAGGNHVFSRYLAKQRISGRRQRGAERSEGDGAAGLSRGMA